MLAVKLRETSFLVTEKEKNTMNDLFNPINLHILTQHLSSLSQALYVIGEKGLYRG